jgi:chemotaxis protein methyltransferase CheR
MQWALPRLGLRVAAYRRVGGQVEKRVRRRIAALALDGVAAYRARLAEDPQEWNVLRSLCGITISRFYRDRTVWDAVCDRVLPALAAATRSAGGEHLRCWSLGCASGEEPYTLSIAWQLALAERYPEVRLTVLATDVDEHMLSRAMRAEYEAGSLREMPTAWRELAFEQAGETYRLHERFRGGVQLQQQDVRSSVPEGEFALILCRNNVFSYFDPQEQQRALQQLTACLSDGAFMVIGKDEQLPPGSPLHAWDPKLRLYQR